MPGLRTRPCNEAEQVPADSRAADRRDFYGEIVQEDAYITIHPIGPTASPQAETSMGNDVACAPAPLDWSDCSPPLGEARALEAYN